MGQHGAERTHDGDFEAVEDPGYSQRRHDHPVPARPGESIHALRHIGIDRDAACLAYVRHCLTR